MKRVINAGATLEEWREEAARWTEKLVNALGGEPKTRCFPAVNIWDDERSLVIEADLPGIRIEDVEVNATASELTIKGYRGNGSDAQRNYYSQERVIGPFERAIRLPYAIDNENMTASLRDGVLTITLAKQPQAQSRRVEIRNTP